MTVHRRASLSGVASPALISLRKPGDQPLGSRVYRTLEYSLLSLSQIVRGFSAFSTAGGKGNPSA